MDPGPRRRAAVRAAWQGQHPAAAAPVGPGSGSFLLAALAVLAAGLLLLHHELGTHASHVRSHLQDLAQARAAQVGNVVALMLDGEGETHAGGGPIAPGTSLALRELARRAFAQNEPRPDPRGSSTGLIRREGDMIVGASGLRPLPITTPDLLAASVLRGERSYGTVAEGRDFRGVRVLGVVQPVPGTDWFVVARRSVAGVQAEAWRSSAWTIAATLVGLAMVELVRRRQQSLARARWQARQDEQLHALHLIQAIADQSGDAIFAKDLDGRYLVCNDEAARLMGCAPGQAEGRTDHELLAPDDAAQVVAMDANVRAEARARTFEESLDTADGRRTFLTTKAPLFDADGQMLGVFGIARDITDRIRAEAALRAAVQLVQAVQDSQPDPMTVLDPEGRIVAINAAWTAFARANGGDPATLGVGADYLGVCHAAAGPASEGAQEVAAGLQAVLETRLDQFTHQYPCHAPGTPRWFHLSAVPLRTGRGGAIVVHTDITERHLAQQQLRQLATELDAHRHHLQELVAQRTEELQQANLALSDRERFIHTLADNQPALLSYWDQDLQCRFANRAWREWFGDDVPMADGGGTMLPDALMPEEAPSLWEVMSRGESRQVLRELRARDGRSQHGLASFIPDMVGGEVCGFLVLVSDVTELRNTELRLQRVNAELRQSRDRAEAANRAKSAFLANTSHELRTPMNAIVGLTHLVHRQSNEPLARERLHKVSEAAARLMGMIDDILDLASIEAGRTQLRNEAFMLDAVLARCVSQVADLAHRKGLPVDVHRDGAPPALRGDATRLAQAISSLLGNAIKFTEQGRVTLEVSRLDADDRHPLLRFLVRDTGIGIPPEQQDCLFGAFVQADMSPTRRFGGTGLGLALTQRLAGLMQGEVGLRSEPGRGSEFWFTARLQAADAAEAPHPSPNAVPSAGAAEATGRPPSAAASAALERPSAADLDRLERKLEAADFDAVRLHRSLAPALRTHAPEAAQALEHAILGFDHATALSALRALRRTWPD